MVAQQIENESVEGGRLEPLTLDSSEQSIEELSLLSPTDELTLRNWNKHVPPAIQRCIHDIIYDRAIAAPESDAVCAWDASWSYARLDEISSRLAYLLIREGVRPGVIVPICIERSGWMVIAMVGVLKAGGTFTPCDPALPYNRRREIIQASASSIILTSTTHANLYSGWACTIFVVEPALLSVHSEEELIRVELHADPNTAAYVIFTSGTTGQPKGVVIDHNAYSSSALAHGPVHGIDSNARVLQFASYSVDAICLEILTTLMMGGCICLPSTFARNNNLSDAMNEMRVTVAALTPSVLMALSPAEIPSLETLIMVGEPAPLALVERWTGHAHLINGYGPTETSLAAVMNQTMTAATGSIIGRAVGCVTWIVDSIDHDRLVPLGSIGELLIEGPTLARGYLNDEEKTAAAFIVNPPWLKKPGTRLYKTGDLVRYEPDGTIRFIGRRDTQVKINGQRVELGEIEHHITVALPCADQTVLEMVERDEKQSRSLVAFLIIKTQDDRERLGLNDKSDQSLYSMTAALKVQLEDLERSLVQSLPAYMVPALWVPLSEVPTTLAGKIDRAKLRDIALAVANTVRSQYSLAGVLKRVPTSQGGKCLRKLWASVLKMPLEEIGADDSFFHIGGDSLSAMKLAGDSSIQGLPLTVAEIFLRPILDDMAKSLEGRADNDKHSKSVTSRPTPLTLLGTANLNGLLEKIHRQLSNPKSTIDDVMPTTDFQSYAVAFGCSRSIGLVDYMFLSPSEPLDSHRLEFACRQTVAAHPILRTTFVLDRDRMLQVILTDSPRFEHIHCPESIDNTWDKWLQVEMQKPLRLGESIVQFLLLSHGSAEQRLVMRISHAQLDGISFPLIYQSLSHAYAGRDIPESSPYSAFINTILEKKNSLATRAYWRDLLHGSEMISMKRLSRPSYDRPLDRRVEQLIPVPSFRNGDFAIATLIKASWSLVLSFLTNETDVVFGSTVSGRSTPTAGVQKNFGRCQNVVPVRIRIDFELTAGEFLRHVQNQEVASLPFQSLGFRDIIRETTTWPSWTRFSSVVEYQDSGELADEVLIGDGADGGVMCHTSRFRMPSDTNDLVILAAPAHENKLKLELAFCERNLTPTEAKTLLNCLCGVMDQLSNWPDSKLEGLMHQFVCKHESHCYQRDPIPRHLYQATSEAGNVHNKTSSSESPHALTSSRIPAITTAPDVAAIVPQEDTKLETKIRSLWREVLALDIADDDDRHNNDNNATRKSTVELALSTSFFSLPGADIVAVCFLATRLRQEGYDVEMEDVIDNDTLKGQVGILKQKGRSVSS